MSEAHHKENEAASNGFPKWVEDLKSISKDKLIRGFTPANIEQRCLSLVQSYLGGSWCNAASAADIAVRRISGGLTNQLYHVQLKDSVARSKNPVYSDEPTEVAIKFYQAKHITNYHPDDPERLNDTVILNLMSQCGLSPQVYGIFEDGFLQAYHEHEQLRAKHQADPVLRKQLIKLLVQFAHLKVPIRKEANLLLEQAGEYISHGYGHFGVQALAEELQLKHLSSTDLLAEHRELMRKVGLLQAPLVLCHNDFRGSNLLVIKKNVKSKEQKESILAVDIEHAGYGTRGYDLACIFLESSQTELLDLASPPPTDETLQSYVRLYWDACEEEVPGYKDKVGNSFEQHLREARLMVLFNKFFIMAFLIGQKEPLVATMPIDRKKNLAFAELILADYLQTKESYIEKNFY